MKTFYDFILKLLRPFVKWWGGLHFPFTRKKVTGIHYYKYRDLIKTGTVLLTKTEGELSNYINPVSKEIKHGGLYIGSIKGIPTVIEAVGKGVVFTDLVSFLTSKDRVIALKPDFITDNDRVMIRQEAEKRKGLPYDYLFRSGNKKFYCFELIVDIFKSVRSNAILKYEEIVKGYKIYDEGTFLNDERFFILFDTKDS